MKKLILAAVLSVISSPSVPVPARADIPHGTYTIEGVVVDQNGDPISQCSVDGSVSVYVRNADGTLFRYAHVNFSTVTGGDGGYEITVQISAYVGNKPFAGAAASLDWAAPPPPWLVTSEQGGTGEQLQPPIPPMQGDRFLWLTLTTVDEHQ